MTLNQKNKLILDKLVEFLEVAKENPNLVSIDQLQHSILLAREFLPRLSVEDILSVAYEQLDHLTNHKSELANSLNVTKAGVLQEFETSKNSATNSIEQAKTIALDALAQSLSDAQSQLDINSINKRIDRATPKMSVLFSSFSRLAYQSPWSRTNELPTAHNPTNMQRLFSYLTLVQDIADSAYSPRFGRLPRTLLPFGSHSNRVAVDQHYVEYAVTSNQYSFPEFNIGALFLTNLTGADKTITPSFGYGSYNTNNGAQLFSVIPDQTDNNLANVTNLSFTSHWSYSSSNVSITNASLTIPANKTIALVLATSDYFFANSSGYHFIKAWGFDNLSSWLDADIEVNTKLTNIAAHENVADIADIWKLAA